MMYNTIQKSNSAPHKKQQRAWTEQELELLCQCHQPVYHYGL